MSLLEGTMAENDVIFSWVLLKVVQVGQCVLECDTVIYGARSRAIHAEVIVLTALNMQNIFEATCDV